MSNLKLYQLEVKTPGDIGYAASYMMRASSPADALSIYLDGGDIDGDQVRITEYHDHPEHRGIINFTYVETEKELLR